MVKFGRFGKRNALLISLYRTQIASMYSGADPGFGIRGGVSRRGVWGPLKVPQRFKDRALVGGPGGQPPP